MRVYITVLSVAAFVLSCSPTLIAQCVPHWSDEFAGSDAIARNPSQGIRTSAVFNSPAGPLLCLGGLFDALPGVAFSAGNASQNLACYDGHQWRRTHASAQGVQLTEVNALAVFDDGSGHGPELYVGGVVLAQGTPGVARWDGTTWRTVDAGFPGTVRALAAFDAGDGPQLYAAGDAPSLRNIARWDGAAWRPLGPVSNLGVNGSVRDLAVLPSPKGDRLVLAGSFSRDQGSAQWRNLITWNGSAFSLLDSRFPNAPVSAAEFVPGEGLYITGSFDYIGVMPTGVRSVYISRFDGTHWNGFDFSQWDGSPASSLTYIPSGEPVAPGLYIAGSFRHINQQPINCIMRYTPAGGFQELGVGLAEDSLFASSMSLFGSGSERRLYVGGNFRQAGTVQVANLAAFDGATWSRAGNAPTQGRVDFRAAGGAVATFHEAGGDSIIFGGAFGGVGDSNSSGLARLRGTQWSSIAGDWGRNGQVNDLVAGRGPDDTAETLYVLGTMADGPTSLGGVLRTDGATRSVVGGGVVGSPIVGALFDADLDGRNELYVGGLITSAGGNPAGNIARWDGSAWSRVGDGLDSAVLDLHVFDDGGGPALYACGWFTHSGAAPINCIARLRGNTWEALGAGLAEPLANRGLVAVAMTTYTASGEPGPSLYVLGSFQRAGNVQTTALARWDGSAWHAADAGITDIYTTADITTDTNGALAVFDDGSGEKLYIAHTLIIPSLPGGPRQLVHWNGTSLEDLPDQPNDAIRDLHVHSANHERVLLAAGTFSNVGEVSSPVFAQYIACDPCDRRCDWDASGAVNSQDFFGFLTDFFAGAADYNNDASTTSQDLFDFLTCFFTPC